MAVTVSALVHGQLFDVELVPSAQVALIIIVLAATRHAWIAEGSILRLNDHGLQLPLHVEQTGTVLRDGGLLLLRVLIRSARFLELGLQLLEALVAVLSLLVLV